MQNEALRSVNPSLNVETSASSQWCIASDTDIPICVYSHEAGSLILAIAVLIRAIQGSR